MGRPWWAKVASAMWPSTVVVANVFREHDTQVPLTEDQHAVGEFGSQGADEPAWRNPATWMLVSARTASNDAVNCPARSRTTNRNRVTRSPGSITRLRICWVVYRPSGFVVVPSRYTERLGTSSTKNT